MGKVTEQLESIIPAAKNTDELYKIFQSINDFDLPIIRMVIKEGASLLRQRVNIKDKEFNYISELSYPPSNYVQNYGRANLPFHPMFYCCSFPSDSQAPEPRIITLLETSDFFKDKIKVGIERSTLSKWLVKKPIKLIVLPFYDYYERAVQDIIDVQNEWNRAIKEIKLNDDAKELIDYMSSQISQDVSNNIGYFKIANFVYYLLYSNEKTKNADGIMYPSVPAKGDGFNVVLKPESADEKLEFSVAALCYLAKNRDKSYLMIKNQSTGIREDGYITYTPRDIDEEENRMYQNHAQGLEFVN
jgi:hypothetical protein